MPFTPKFVDLVRNSTSVQGTGPVTLGAAVSGFTGFAAAVTTGEQFYYCIQSVDKAAEREVGRGTMQANGTIAREAISGTLTNFTSGSKTIALVAAAEWFSRLDLLGAAGSAPFDVASRGALALASLTGARPAYLCEKGREGLFVFDPSNLTAKVAADSAQGVFIAPATAPTGSAGAWVRQFDGALRLEWFGAVPGDYATGIGADCLSAWNACMSYLAANKRNNFPPFYRSSPEIHFPGAQYYFSDTLQIKHTIRLRGMGSGYSGGASTMLRFAADKAGIVVNRYNTLGDVEESPATTGGDGSIIEGFYLLGGGGTPDLLKSGVRMRARAVIRDCLIGSFAGAGVCIVCDTSTAASNPYYGNANNWRIDNVRVQYNRYGGVYVSGGDANAGLATMCDASQNARYGIADSAFLGNSWIGCHTDANGMNLIAGGLQQTSVVTDGTNRYYLVHGQDANAATTPPTAGASNAVWALLGGGGVHANIPTWTALLSYASGGAYGQTGTANQSVFDGCYYETGQAPPQILGAAMVVGGFMGNGLPTGAPHVRGNVGSGMRSQRQYTQSVVFGDGTTGSVALGGPVVGNTVPVVQWGSADATPFNPNFPAFLRSDGDTGDLYWDSYGFRQPLRLTGYSTARTYGGRTQADCRYTTEIDRIALGNGANAGNSSIIMQYGTAAPTTGVWGRGDIVWNNGAGTSIAAVNYWRCSVAGTPGTWIAEGPLSTSASIGYATGAGGTVVQATSKSTGVTLNKATGQISMSNASLAAGETVTFLLTTNMIGATDVLIVNVAGGATLGSYTVGVGQVLNGFARVQLRNISAGALAEAVVLNFAVIKGAVA